MNFISNKDDICNSILKKLNHISDPICFPKCSIINHFTIKYMDKIYWILY